MVDYYEYDNIPVQDIFHNFQVLRLHVNTRNSAQQHNGLLCNHGYPIPMSNLEFVVRIFRPIFQSKKNHN